VFWRRSILIWTIIVGVFAIDIVWLEFSALSVDSADAARIAETIATLILIAIFCAAIKRYGAVQRTAQTLAQCIAFLAIAAVLSYLVTTTCAPLADRALLSVDLRLGFNWTAWTAWVDSHASVHRLLAISYALLFPEMLLCLLWLPLAGSGDELISMLVISLLITIALSGFVPAIGHLPHAAQVPSVIALRSGTMRTIALSHTQGLITFPSFHTSLALTLLYASRRSPWLLPLTCMLTVAVLLSVPSEGGHYLTDMIGGVAVAIIAGAIVPRSWAPAPGKTFRSNAFEFGRIASRALSSSGGNNATRGRTRPQLYS
jgi:hypothetical protein